MKLHDVYDEVDAFTVDDNVIKEAIPTRWVPRKKKTRRAKQNRRKRLHREDRGRRLRLPLYTNVHDATDTSCTTDVTAKLDRATRRRLYGISKWLSLAAIVCSVVGKVL